MGYWQQRAVTDVGNEMLNDLMAGRKLTICSAYGGTEKAAEDALAGLTDVSGDRHELGLLGLEKAPEGKMVRVQINNVDIEQGYTLHQIGVYAKLDDEPEQLLFILQDERGVDIPSVTENPSFALEVQGLIYITNDVEIKISLEGSKAMVTPAMLAQLLSDHNADPQAHPGLTMAIKQVLDQALEEAGSGNLEPGAEPPGPDTPAEPGQHYFDAEAKKEYICIGQDEEGNYLWMVTGAGVDASQIMYEGKPLTAFLKTLEESASTDRAIQNIPTQYGTLTYTGEEQTLVLNGYDSATVLLTGVLAATDAGEYEALATPKQPYFWGADGSTNTKPIKWRIDRQPVEAVTQTNTLTYTGEEQSPAWEGIRPDIMTVSGQQAGTEAGEYIQKITLDNNYCWPDGTYGEKEFPWEIARITLEAVPCQSVENVYTGAEQSPSWTGYDPEKMTVTGPTAATESGGYTVEFIPGPNYQWPDGTHGKKEVMWTIAKAAGSITLSQSVLNLKASAMSAIIGVTRPGDGVITATSSNAAVATATVNGERITVQAKTKGSATITINVSEGTNYTAPESKQVPVTVTLPTTTMADNGWDVIADVGAAGNAANFWSVGDSKDVVINGKVGNFTFSSLTVKAFIIGINHNSTREGNGVHFLLGKIGTAEIALCDGKHGNQGSAGYFIMNTSNTNSGGWDVCYMNKTLLNGASNSLLTALPATLQSAIKSITKYTDNVGGNQNNAASVTGKPCKLFLLSEFEVFGGRSYANSAEQNYQQQYAYFKAGNSKIANHHTAVTTAVWWWLRSPYYNGNDTFCVVGSNGYYTGDDAYYSGGLRAGFCVSAA
ncbi:DUF6273 domain-containing protein [Acutalibacter sp. 1XD8-36]|uniref:DUF6273 domain-containing protein n=1 Tax=Acutalibacter sp. 1XD8-36 TaxID=2320852 RepID=UPI0014120C74|nr:DUF6273 domain-containing protein [Acutalibacter sp. 1XD8-36]NBJ87940.1 hypothetical protein [Acutalibacter sp. 1XD8-36]